MLRCAAAGARGDFLQGVACCQLAHLADARFLPRLLLFVQAVTDAKVGGGKKYMRRGDARAEAQQGSGGSAGAPREGDTARSGGAARAAAKEAGGKGSGAKLSASASAVATMSLAQVFQRLRGLGEPVTYFGEVDEQRRARLAAKLDESAEALAAQGEDGMKRSVRDDAFRQDMQRLADKAKETARAAAADRATGIAGSGGGEGGEAKEGGKEGGAPADEGGAAAEGGGKGEGGGAAAAAAAAAAGAGGGDFAARVAEAARIAKNMAAEAALEEDDRAVAYLQRLLREWGEELGARGVEALKTYEGMQAVASHRQTESFIKPLLDKLRERDLDQLMRWNIFMILRLMRDREYLKASDKYVQICIGNAPWPIGVTSVGIHARSGRERISETNKNFKAHVMTDETTRKYLVSLKRLITFAQRRYPSDPSKCLEFNSLANGSDLLSLTGRDIAAETGHLRDETDFRAASVKNWVPPEMPAPGQAQGRVRNKPNF